MALPAPHILKKINKRLHVVDAGGASVYSPPSFLSITDRRRFDALLADLNAGRRLIHAIMDFECANHPVKSKRCPS